MSQLDDVRELAGVMRELGIRRASMTRDGIEVELYAEPAAPAAAEAVAPQPAPAPVPAEPPPLPPEVKALLEDAKPQVCACGHLWNEEHSEAGCLMGCDMGSCGQVAVPPPETKGN